MYQASNSSGVAAIFLATLCYCVVPENIHTSPKRGIFLPTTLYREFQLHVVSYTGITETLLPSPPAPENCNPFCGESVDKGDHNCSIVWISDLNFLVTGSFFLEV